MSFCDSVFDPFYFTWIIEKPVGASVADVRKAWSTYQALAVNDKKLPIWAVAENYRFEPALIQVYINTM